MNFKLFLPNPNSMPNLNFDSFMAPVSKELDKLVGNRFSSSSDFLEKCLGLLMNYASIFTAKLHKLGLTGKLPLLVDSILGDYLMKCNFCSSSLNSKPHVISFKQKLKDLFGVSMPENNETLKCCPMCFPIVSKVSRSPKFKVHRDTVISVNKIRQKKGLSKLMVKHRQPTRGTSESATIFQPLNDSLSPVEKLKMEKQRSRESSPWYDMYKVDYVSCKIELPILIELLENQKCDCSASLRCVKHDISSSGK